MKKFSNDVHNGVFDNYDIDNDMEMVMEYKERVYKQIEDQPPEPIIEPKEEVEPPQVKVPEVKNLDPHTVLTMEQLTNKIKNEELIDTLNMKKDFNPKEGNYLENKIKEVNPDIIEQNKRDKK
jgi:hypothetical protein